MGQSDILDIGSRYRRVDSAVTSLTISAGNTNSVELPRSLLYRYMLVRINGSANYSVAPATILAEGGWNMINKLEIVADGRKTLWSIDGPALNRLSHIYRGKQGEFVPLTAITGAQPYTATAIIDFHAWRMVSPVDSYFDPRIFEKVELRVTWAAGTAMTTGGTFVSNTGTLDIQLMQTAIGADRILFNKLVTFDEISPAGASTNVTQRVPRIGLLAGILLRSLVSSVSSDALINKVSLKSDNNFLHIDSLTWKTIQTRNALEYQIDLPGAAAAAGGVMPPGWAYIDLTEDGMIPSSLNALDLNTLDLIFDVASAGTIRITYVFFEPITA